MFSLMSMKTPNGSKKNKKNSKPLVFSFLGKKVDLKSISAFNKPGIVLCATILGIVLFFPYTPSVPSFDLPKEGEVAKETVIAPFTFDVLKQDEELAAERKTAMDGVFLVLRYDTAVAGAVAARFLELGQAIRHVRSKSTQNLDSAVVPLGSQLKLTDNAIKILIRRPHIVNSAGKIASELLEKGVVATLIAESVDKLNELKSRNLSVTNPVIYTKPFVTFIRGHNETQIPTGYKCIKPVALENVTQLLKTEQRVDNAALETIVELLDVYLQPNVFIDEKECADRKEQAANDVLVSKGKIIVDSEIMRKHEVITADVIQKLYSLHVAQEQLRQTGEKRKIFFSNLGRLLVTIVPLIFFAAYIRHFHRNTFNNIQHLWALASLVVLQVLCIRLGLLIAPRLIESSADGMALTAAYSIPTVIGAILTTMLFGLEMSFSVTLFSALFFSMVFGFDLYLFMYAMLGGVIAGWATQRIRYRWDFFKAIPPVIGIYCLIIALLQLVTYRIEPAVYFQNCGLAAISTILSIFLSMMVTPIFESMFDITTDMTLIELSDMNHPIFKRLSIEASGTYNHSILVGNLAESAAERIGANALLARVASYYHDIGKIEKSEYFIENYPLDKDKHNKLSPSMSALIISSHVKDGVELARRYKLPKVIQYAILQHHGTSTVSYFYEKALELDPHKQVQEKDFRYPGPTPQTRENAIIMLADSVEAASRSLATKSQRLQRELVKRIIREKFMSSQLDQCDLTLRDLDELVEGFMPVLQGIYHTRIEYPPTKESVS